MNRRVSIVQSAEKVKLSDLQSMETPFEYLTFLYFWPMFSAQGMQCVDRELFLELTESPMNPTFIHKSPPSPSAYGPLFRQKKARRPGIGENRPVSYSNGWTGSSMKWRLMRAN